MEEEVADQERIAEDPLPYEIPNPIRRRMEGMMSYGIQSERAAQRNGQTWNDYG